MDYGLIEFFFFLMGLILTFIFYRFVFEREVCLYAFFFLVHTRTKDTFFFAISTYDIVIAIVIIKVINLMYIPK